MTTLATKNSDAETRAEPPSTEESRPHGGEAITTPTGNTRMPREPPEEAKASQDGETNSNGLKEKDRSGSSEDDIAEQREEGVREYDDDDDDNDAEGADNALKPTTSHAKEIWKFRMRPPDDDESEDWWFASTAIPLLAATTGPLANVLSIAALVVPWRDNYSLENPGVDDLAVGYPDPGWCTALNTASLVCGFAGNIFLLFNFTRFVRYIVALPLTIVLWFLASAILISITACMHSYAPAKWPDATYSQGFWHAVIAATLYLISALMLMINMLGYFLGHYTQHFELTDEQRNLILQTMMFFIWLAGGAGVFARVCDWSYVDALYFCDVTVLTVGFGDFAAPNDVGRGLVFPYSVGGIIMLGLMVSSIRRFAMELGHDKIVRNHVERRRIRTMERSVSSSVEVERRAELENAMTLARSGKGEMPTISAPFDPQQRTIAFDEATNQEAQAEPGVRKQMKKKAGIGSLLPLKRTMTWASDKISGPPSKGLASTNSHNGRLLILKEEKDRFMAMRAIQYDTRRFKRYFALSMSVIAFGLLWCVGSVVFWICEYRTQGLTYFQALYFCYVSLLTIGYGDLSPKSNAGKAFFVVWSLIAVPTMTILVSDMGETVVAAYKRGTFTLAAWTVLPTKGFFREFLDTHPGMMQYFRRLQSFAKKRAERKRLERGFQVGPDPDPQAVIAAEEGKGDDPGDGPTLEELADEEIDEHDLARRLTLAIRRTADHLKGESHRRYTYEEWVEYTRLIRFSDYDENEFSGEDDSRRRSGSDSGSGVGAKAALDIGAEDKGIVEWDWIGANSPMMADQSEVEWVLDRLCESLDRYMRKQLPAHVRQRHRDQEADIRRRRTAPLPPNPDAGTSEPSSPSWQTRPGTDGAPFVAATEATQGAPTAQARRSSVALGVGLSSALAAPTPAGRGRSFGRRQSSTLGGALGLLAEAHEQAGLGLGYRRRSSASGGGGSRRASATGVAMAAERTGSGGRGESASSTGRRASAAPRTSAEARAGVEAGPGLESRAGGQSRAEAAPRKSAGDRAESDVASYRTVQYRDPFLPRPAAAEAGRRGERSTSAERRLKSAGHTIDAALQEADEPPEGARGVD